MTYAALLRLDAISQIYGPVARPGWLRHLQESRTGASLLRPAAVHWAPTPVFPHRDGPPSQYRSDPYTYLQHARAMRWFYSANLREPVFPFAVKVWLFLLGDQDVAVSFASAAFSILTVLAAFLLGREAFSYAVGAGAAALLAIEYDVISSSVEGWRDDAFACLVVLTAWMLLRCIRDPTRRNSMLFGCVSGVSCLVRITSLSFLMPAFAFLLLAPKTSWGERRKACAWAAGIACLTVAPYLVNCWRVYGDPFYAINAHADVYRATEGDDVTSSRTVRQFIDDELHARPMRTLETFALGMTEYPFANKWTGFEPWVSGIGRWLAAASLAGLFLFVLTPAGRVLLVILAGSLIPYAFTWRLIADRRFTEHAYPFFMLAAGFAVWTLVMLFVPGRLRGIVATRPSRARAAVFGVFVVLLAAGWYVVVRVLPQKTFVETLTAGEPAMIVPGQLDAAFFADGWDAVVWQGAVSTRRAAVPRPAVTLPLPAVGDYDALLRVDSGDVDILFNGAFVSRCDPGATPERIGVCHVRIPAHATRPGVNRLTFVPAGGGPLRAWYFRLQRARS